MPYYIDKTTSTFADELLAAGFIRLLEQLLDQQGQAPDIMQIDHGHYYEIQTGATLDLERVKTTTTPFPLAPIIRTLKNAKSLPDLPEHRAYVIDYDQERDQRGAFLTAFKGLEKTAKKAYIIGDDANFPFDLMPPPPHEHWDIFRLLNPAALIGYNSLMTQWLEIGDAGKTGAICCLLCELFSQTPNDLAACVEESWKPLAKATNWKTDTSASQFFNPPQGKGINKPLPNGVGLSNLSSFWLLEWLKMIGFYQIAFTRTLQGVNDRKTYVPVVGRADWTTRQKVQTIFEKRMRFAETAVLSDILTIIRYTTALVERVATAQRNTASEQEQAFLALLGEMPRPADFIRGFHTVFYKDLGNAVTTMNIAFLNLPGWIEIRQPEDIATFQAILAEHENIVRQFAENKGEELTLLTYYRDFIVADNLDPFFEFTTAYSSWLISQGDKSRFPPRKFTTHNLRRLLVSNQSNLSEILDAPGFVNIAYAIRQSTVTAQYRKTQGDRRYDIRYGLGRDLVRQSQYPDEFLASLSDFLHKYNAENAQVMETRPAPYRRSVQTSDIQDIVQLIDKHGSDLIAKLLVAYGYARESRTPLEIEEEETTDETTTSEFQ
ncbi:MAG: hypothetical protein KC423_05590 [Anaerolineales bacterium]|nr:hypothetical protein [Anaerolineales bacterium]